jgi:PST family polysaccharide transporter
MARFVSATDFGVVSAALVVIGLSSIFSHLGFGPALVQRTDLEQRHVESAFSASVLFGALIGAIIWAGAPAAAEFLRIEGVLPVLRTLAWVFPLQGLGVTADALQRRDLRFQWLANVDVACYALGYGVVGVALALAGWGVWALVAGQIAQVVLRSSILLVKQPPRLGRLFEMRAFRELLYFGGGFTVARAANYLAVQGDNLVVGRYLGSEALGYFGRAHSLMNAPAYGFGAVLDQVLFPAMAKVQNEPQRLAAAYQRGVALIALITLAPSAALILVGPELIDVVLGHRWAAVVAPFQILTIGMLFRTSYKMSDSLARSTGAVYRRAWRQIIYALLVVLGAWIGQHWGITGAAWGTLAALTANFLMMAELSLSVSGMRWLTFWRAHLPAIRLTVISFPIVWATAAALRHWGLPPVVVLSAVACVVVAATLVLCWRAPRLFLGPDGVWILDALRGFLPRRPAANRRTPDAEPAMYKSAAAGETP